MTLKNNRAPHLCCFERCASFHSHWWIQTKVAVRKRSIRVKMGDLLSCVTLKFDGWPWKTIGQLFFVAPSFMRHFIAISEFKLKFQSGNAQFGSKSTIFEPCDLEIWWMTLTNKRAPFLSNIKLYPSFHHHMWTRTGAHKLGHDLCDLDLWPMTLTFCMDISSVIGNSSWKFRDDTMIGT